MRFEDVPAGESRQINGPLWGVRVLSAGVGAALLVDRSPVPVASLLLTLRAPEARPYDRLNMTGPIVLQIAETPDDDLSAAGVAPPVAIVTPTWTPQILNAGPVGGVSPDWLTTWLLPVGAQALIVYHRNLTATATVLKGVRFYGSDGAPIHGTATDLFGAGPLNLTASDTYLRPHFAFGAPEKVAGLGVRAGALVPFVATAGPPPSRVDITIGSAGGAIAAGQITLQGNYW